MILEDLADVAAKIADGAGVAVVDEAVAVEDDVGGKAADVEEGLKVAVGVLHLYALHVVRLDVGGPGIGGVALVDFEEDEGFGVEAVEHGLDVAGVADAEVAPGAPEVDEDDFAGEGVEGDGLTVQVVALKEGAGSRRPRSALRESLRARAHSVELVPGMAAQAANSRLASSS